MGSVTVHESFSLCGESPNIRNNINSAPCSIDENDQVEGDVNDILVNTYLFLF